MVKKKKKKKIKEPRNKAKDSRLIVAIPSTVHQFRAFSLRACRVDHEIPRDSARKLQSRNQNGSFAGRRGEGREGRLQVSACIGPIRRKRGATTLQTKKFRLVVCSSFSLSPIRGGRDRIECFALDLNRICLFPDQTVHPEYL